MSCRKMQWETEIVFAWDGQWSGVEWSEVKSSEVKRSQGRSEFWTLTFATFTPNLELSSSNTHYATQSDLLIPADFPIQSIAFKSWGI